MLTQTNIVIRTSFSALHCWPDCPIKEVSYLKQVHRHVFHVEMKWPVNHNDRDIEFIQMKNRVNKWLQLNYEGADLGATSCEMMCEELMGMFQASFVSVFEDNENGAEMHHVQAIA